MEINGHVIGGLLDSGANITILGRGNEELIKSLIDQKSISKQLSIRTADGTIHSTQAVIDVPYTTNGETKKVSTLVIPTITTQLILGTDFWEAFNIRPMFCCAIEGDGDSEKPPKFDPVNVKHDLTADQAHHLAEVVATFEAAPSEGLLGCTDRTLHVIDTGDAKPIKQRQYVLSPYIQQGVIEEINRMLARGIIQKTDNPTWLNPVVAVRKSNGKIRLCIDARRLNDATV